jgi:hypothetical protein
MKTILIITFLALFSHVHAPPVDTMYIPAGEKISPYAPVLRAMARVESSNNPFAYNAKEMAVGLWQIRDIRLRDYYRLTGVRYYPCEMFDVAKATDVIMFYFKRFGPYRIDDAILSWNCNSKEYLKRVKSVL